MAETPLTGLTAAIKIGEHASAETIAYVSGVDLTLEAAILEILAFGMTYKEKVPAVKDWSATVNGTCAFTSTGTQKQLYDAYNNGTTVTLGIYLSDTTYFEGKCYVKSMKISAAPDDAIKLECEVAGSGATLLTLPA